MSLIKLISTHLLVLIAAQSAPVPRGIPQPEQNVVSIRGYLTPDSSVSEICEEIEGAEIVQLYGELYSDYWTFRIFLQCSSVNTVTAHYNPFYDPCVPLTRAPGPFDVSNSTACRSQGASLSAYIEAAREFGFRATTHKPCTTLIQFNRSGDDDSAGIDVYSDYWDGARCNMTSECSAEVLNQVLRILPVTDRVDRTSIYVPLTSNDTRLVSALIRTPMVSLMSTVTIRDTKGNESVLLFQWSHAISFGMKTVLHVAHDLGSATKAFFEGISVTTEEMCAEYKFYAQVAAQFVNSFGLMAPVMNVRDDEETLEGSLASLIDLHQSDKYCHGYHRFYPHFLSRYKAIGSEWKGQLSMLEIGVFRGASINIWRKYLPDVFVFAIDIFQFGDGDGYRIYVGDQSDIPFLRRVKRDIDRTATNKLFLIVDDGSHRPANQIASFNYLFTEVLMLGGTYIIEDVETSYWAYKDDPDSTIDVFKQLVDEINYKYWKHTENETESKRGIQGSLSSMISPETKRFVSTITFGQNCISVVKKTFEELVVFDDMSYRFKDTLGMGLMSYKCHFPY
jgi:hypothetical protein